MIDPITGIRLPEEGRLQPLRKAAAATNLSSPLGEHLRIYCRKNSLSSLFPARLAVRSGELRISLGTDASDG